MIPLKSLGESIRQSKSLSHKTIVLTFDDGFKNFYNSAYPVLKEFGYQATVFLVPGYLGKSSQWNDGLSRLPVLDLLNWDQVKELSDDGIDFGAHTMTHPDFSKLDSTQTRSEIIDSKVEIQRHLGEQVPFFSFPYGTLTMDTLGIVREEFQGACSTIMDFVSMESDIFQLPRIDMFYFSNNPLFHYIGTP
ncbi:MAG: polysaccharide deacetylase family protein, partial [Candidatus Hodarchaeales archaeon]